MLNIRAVICVSEKVSPERTNAIKRFKAEVIKHGEDQDQAGIHARLLAKEEGLTMIHPFDDPYVIAGQGTIGLELIDDLPGIDTVIVPLAGGGLLSGIAIALKAAKPETRIIGVSAEHAPSMAESISAGRPVEVEERKTIARSLEGSIGLDNSHTFSIVKDLVDEVLLASEEEIEEALSFMIFRQRLVVEGAAAVGPAMLLRNRVKDLGENTVIVMTGGSLDSKLLLRVAKRGIGQAIN
jgi:threonine dehydratase